MMKWCSGLALWLLFAGQAAAAGRTPERGWLDPLKYRDTVAAAGAHIQQLEIAQMLSTIARGSGMGPGGGWFHDGQSRYNWKWLAASLDRNADGKITPEEFPGGADLFQRLDRDRSGDIRPDDFDWTDRSPFVRMTGMARQWTARINDSSNGKISKEEWLKFFESASKGKGYLTPDDLRDRLLMQPRPSGPRGRGPSPSILLAGLFNGEIGSLFEGPRGGERAPSFSLKTQDGAKMFRLRDYRGKKPVVLIFGSFT